MRTLIRYFATLAAIVTMAVAPLGAVTKKHKTTAKHHVTAVAKKHTTAASKHVKGKKRGKAVPASKTTWRNRQTAPSADRYKEIQEALVSKGYLKSEPNGTWDADSQEAMRKFQADQNLSQSGKVNSLSLIALGLGPKNTGTK